MGAARAVAFLNAGVITTFAFTWFERKIRQYDTGCNCKYNKDNE